MIDSAAREIGNLGDLYVEKYLLDVIRMCRKPVELQFCFAIYQKSGCINWRMHLRIMGNPKSNDLSYWGTREIVRLDLAFGIPHLEDRVLFHQLLTLVAMRLLHLHPFPSQDPGSPEFSYSSV